MGKPQRLPPPPFVTEGMAYQIFRTAHRLGHAFKQSVAEYGLSRTRGAVLMHVAQAPATATDLRRCTGVTAASMSKTLADMEREGVIRRTPNPEDARSMLVYLTEEGEALVTLFPGVLKEIETRAFSGLSDEEQATLRRLLERVRENLGDDGLEGEFGFEAKEGESEH